MQDLKYVTNSVQVYTFCQQGSGLYFWPRESRFIFWPTVVRFFFFWPTVFRFRFLTNSVKVYIFVDRTHMQDLKDVTNNVHYENYRYSKLAPVNVEGKVKAGSLSK